MQFPSSGDQRLYDPDNNNIAARAGFSYNLLRGGSTILHGSYGIFYDRPFDNLWQNLRNNNLLVPLFALSGQPVDYLQPIASLLQTVPSYRNSTYSKLFPEITLYQPGLRDGYVQSYFLGVQRQVSRDLTFELNAVGSLWRKLIASDVINRNLSVPSVLFINPNGRFNPAVAEISYARTRVARLTTRSRPWPAIAPVEPS